jgi:hypothetical protein
MAVRVLMQFVKPSMRLARSLHDRDGRLVAGKGTALSDSVVRLLRGMAVQSVLVEDAELESWQVVRPLAERLEELDRRFAREPSSPILAALRGAIREHTIRTTRRILEASEAGPPAAADDGPGVPAGGPGPGATSP